MNTLSVEALDKRFFGLVLSKNIELFLEVGAYDGQVGAKVKKLLPNSEVHSYEASIHNYNKFKNKINGVNYHNLAISNFIGEDTFFIQAKKNGKPVPKHMKNNSLLKRTENNVQYEKTNVKVDTIDNLFPSSNKNAAMWIDVEGVGYEVLLGAKEFLKNVSLLKIEVESYQFWENQIMDEKIIDLLKEENFTIDSIDQERKNQYNIIFVK